MFPSRPKPGILNIMTGISKFSLLTKIMTTHPIVVRSLEIIVRDSGDHSDLRTGARDNLGQNQLPIPGNDTSWLRPRGI